jgi:hypothetical protein
MSALLSTQMFIEWSRPPKQIVMPGLVPGIHVLAARKTWMAGTSPAMTIFIWSSDFRQISTIPRRKAPELCKNLLPPGGRGECRVPVAPAAACAVVESTRVSHHGRTGTPGIPARNGFNSLFRALPGDRAFLSPSLVDVVFRQLDAGVEASGPHDFAVRKPGAFVNAQPASTASRPASVTIAIRPLCGTRRRELLK